jgi:hypothetical protein
MVFNNDKSFFLTLDGEAAPAKIDLPTEPIETEESQDTPQAASAPTLLVAPSNQGDAAASSASSPVSAAISTDRPAVQNNRNATVQATEPKSTAPVVTPNSDGLTTAEAIAADLAVAEAARPEMTYSTYAPDNLTPGSVLNQRRRAPGAAVKNFRNMAEDLFRS